MAEYNQMNALNASSALLATLMISLAMNSSTSLGGIDCIFNNSKVTINFAPNAGGQLGITEIENLDINSCRKLENFANLFFNNVKSTPPNFEKTFQKNFWSLLAK